MQGIATFKKIAKEGRAKGCRLRENSRGGESKILLPLKEIISVCESRETYTRIIVIDLLIMKFIQSLFYDFFSFQKERVFHVNICALVYDCYFGLLILLIILFGNQHASLSHTKRLGHQS